MEDLKSKDAVDDGSVDSGGQQSWREAEGMEDVTVADEDGDDAREQRDPTSPASEPASDAANEGISVGVSSDGGGDSAPEDIRSDESHVHDDAHHNERADGALFTDHSEENDAHHDTLDSVEDSRDDAWQRSQRKHKLGDIEPRSNVDGEGDGANDDADIVTSSNRKRTRRETTSAPDRWIGEGVSSPGVGRGAGEDIAFDRSHLGGGAEDTPPRGPFTSLSFAGCDESPSSFIAPSEILRNLPIVGRDREAQAVIEALKEVYRDKLRPIEQQSKFDQFHHDVMTDAELQAKPQVLLLGPYSTGKTTTIRHFIGRDSPSMNIAPEPSTDAFQVVMAGTEDLTIKGAALCIVDELPFTGLGQFGAPFLSKLQASVVPAPLLEHLTFVDTPGIMAGEKHGLRRGYPFPQAVKWFADRSDLILLMFDAHKLDLSEEFREVIDAIAKHGDKVRVVLNKAQEVDSDRLMKVYGALMWTIGRALRGKLDAPKVYVGSFWDGPRRHPDDGLEEDCSFDEDEASLRREMMELPKNIGLRKINDVLQRAKLVKIHLQIVFAITDRMPRLWGSEAAQERIMDTLEDVFSEVESKGKTSSTDMPNVEEYRRGLARIDFRDLPRRSRRLLSTMDDIIERDIKQCVTRAGGVRRIYKVNSQAKIGDFLPPPTSSRRLGGRRVTVGGDGSSSVRGPSHSGLNLYSTRRGSSGTGVTDTTRGRMMVDEMEDWESSNASEGRSGYDDGQAQQHDEGLPDDSIFVVTGGGGVVSGKVGQAGGQKEEVPFVLATVIIVMAMLCAAGVAVWKTGNLPPAVSDFISSIMPKA